MEFKNYNIFERLLFIHSLELKEVVEEKTDNLYGLIISNECFSNEWNLDGFPIFVKLFKNDPEDRFAEYVWEEEYDIKNDKEWDELIRKLRQIEVLNK